MAPSEVTTPLRSVQHSPDLRLTCGDSSFPLEDDLEPFSSLYSSVVFFKSSSSLTFTELDFLVGVDSAALSGLLSPLLVLLVLSLAACLESLEGGASFLEGFLLYLC